MKKPLSRRAFVKQVGAAGIYHGFRRDWSLKAAETKPAPDTASAKIRISNDDALPRHRRYGH